MTAVTEVVAAPARTAPRVFLKSRRALPFFNRHPWVFAGAVSRVEGEPVAGAEVALVSDSGEFIARGLYNPHSNIQVRLYSWTESEPLDREFWSARLDEAIALRRRLFGECAAEPDGGASAHRLLNSEADGVSGLIVDRYAGWLVVQFTSLALEKQRDTLTSLLREKLHPRGIWLRTEKGIRDAEGLEIADGLVDGQPPSRPLFIQEHGIRYGVDIVEGQKTGFFLDQRDNREAIAGYVRKHRVLDVFCYTGGFGLSAVQLGGAKEVVGIDSSESALATARANAELNGMGNRFQFQKLDAFRALEDMHAARERFDTVILDPPKLTRHRAGLTKALRAYLSLNQLAVEVLHPDGILVTCSCSGLVTRDMFEEMLSKVSSTTNRRIQILERRGPSADHPTSVHCLENDYLKCYVCRVV